jgi:hypothetical protein
MHLKVPSERNFPSGQTMFGLGMQHLGEHVGRTVVTGGQVPPQLTKLPSRHFTTQSGHGSLQLTVICPPKQDLLEHAELWENADDARKKLKQKRKKTGNTTSRRGSTILNFKTLNEYLFIYVINLHKQLNIL